MSTEPNVNPDGNKVAPTPDKFKIKVGDTERLVTKEEAERLLADSVSASQEYKTVMAELNGYRELGENLRRSMNNQDPESFRKLAEYAGWEEDKIRDAINGADSGRRSSNDDNDDLDYDDDDSGGGGGAMNQTMAKMMQTIKSLEQRINMQAQWAEKAQNWFKEASGRLNQHSAGTAVQNVEAALLNDVVLQPVFDSNNRSALYLKRKMVQTAKRLAKEGRLNEDQIASQVIAEARREADEYGLLDNLKKGLDESTVPTLGGEPGIMGSGNVDFQIEDGEDVPEMDMSKPDFAEALGKNLASSIMGRQ